MKSILSTKALMLWCIFFTLAAGAAFDAKLIGTAWASGAVAVVALAAGMLSYLNGKPV